MAGHLESLPLPEDPALAACAAALNEAGFWAYVFDALGRYVFITDELRISIADAGADATLPLGHCLFSAEEMRVGDDLMPMNLEQVRAFFANSPLPRYLVASNPEERDGLRR